MTVYHPRVTNGAFEQHPNNKYGKRYIKVAHNSGVSLSRFLMVYLINLKVQLNGSSQVSLDRVQASSYFASNLFDDKPRYVNAVYG